MLPEPALTLTLPSIHDGTVLDCRLYHPVSLAASNLRAPPWTRDAAIVAHPYAPMGGCCDDPIVEVVAAQLLRKGFLVGTFNFRGAGTSAGSTSWTARPEREDYMSFVGFLVYYLHYLDPFVADDERDVHAVSLSKGAPVLLLAGYSYGAMITSQLPPLQDILDVFANPTSGSDAAHIRLRAHHLASQQNAILGGVRAAVLERRLQPRSPRMGVRVGGGEGTGPSSPRKSHDSAGRRSFSEAEDKLRKGVHDLLIKTKLHHGAAARHGHRASSHSVQSDPTAFSSSPATPVEDKMAPVAELVVPRPAYLLISPLQGVITHLATMSFGRQATGGPAETKLVREPTLAVYGDRDVFVPASRLKAWAARLRGQAESRFRGEEIAPAGHFWVEEGALGRMSELVGEFAAVLRR